MEKTLMLGKIESMRRSGWQRMRWLESITNSMDINLSKLWEIVEERGAGHAAVYGIPDIYLMLNPHLVGASAMAQQIKDPSEIQ